MGNRTLNQPPVVDLNTLDEEFEIRMEYDSNGNLTRIRKVRRDAGCAIWMAIFFIAGVLSLGYYLFR